MAGSAKNPAKLIGAFDLFPKSARTVNNNLNTFSVLWILPLLSILGSTLWQRHHPHWDNISSVGGLFNLSGLPGYAIGSFIGISIVLALIVVFLSLIVQAMTYALQVQAAQDKTPGLAQLFEVGKKYWLKLFGMALAIGVLTLLGLILLIIPGLIVIRRYFLAPYVMIDKDLSISEAMKESARLSKPHSGYIWSIIGVTILLSLPSIIPVLGTVIAFLLSALYSVAPALRYEELKKLA